MTLLHRQLLRHVKGILALFDDWLECAEPDERAEFSRFLDRWQKRIIEMNRQLPHKE
jgi:hypothetical protein